MLNYLLIEQTLQWNISKTKKQSNKKNNNVNNVKEIAIFEKLQNAAVY